MIVESKFNKNDDLVEKNWPWKALQHVDQLTGSAEQTIVLIIDKSWGTGEALKIYKSLLLYDKPLKALLGD